MYSTHFLYCLITLIVEDLSAYAYFLLKKVGAERTRIWTVTLAPQNKLLEPFFSSNCQKGHENPVSHFTLIAGRSGGRRVKTKNDLP